VAEAMVAEAEAGMEAAVVGTAVAVDSMVEAAAGTMVMVADFTVDIAAVGTGMVAYGTHVHGGYQVMSVGEDDVPGF